MANGKPGDHPLDDILDHGGRVFSDAIDDLVRRVAERLPREQLRPLFDWRSPPPAAEFEAELRALLDELEAEAEGDPLEELIQEASWEQFWAPLRPGGLVLAGPGSFGATFALLAVLVAVDAQSLVWMLPIYGAVLVSVAVNLVTAPFGLVYVMRCMRLGGPSGLGSGCVFLYYCIYGLGFAVALAGGSLALLSEALG